MENNNEQIKVAESRNNIVEDNAQSEGIIDNSQIDKSVENKPKQVIKPSKKPLTPYQKYKNSRNQNGKNYFDFYDDIKVYTHNIYDW